MKQGFCALLKARARQALTGRYLTAMGALVLTDLIYAFMIAFLIPTGFTGRLAGLSLLSYLIILFLTILLLVGHNCLYLNFARGSHAAMGQIFFAFSHHPDRVILITAALFAAGFVCMLPFLLVSFLAYTSWLIGGMSLSAMAGAFGISGLISLALFLLLTVRYAMAFFLYIDHPELNWLQLLGESQRIMKGHGFRYIRLNLSFIGMLLLGVLSMGLALLWVIPYMIMTNTCFYLDLTDSHSDADAQN